MVIPRQIGRCPITGSDIWAWGNFRYAAHTFFVPDGQEEPLGSLINS